MTEPTRNVLNFREIAKTLRKHLRLWVVPTVAITALALGYALVRPATWKASQGILVRDEAVGNLSHQGRFDSSDAMKAAQETILEVARNRTVVTAALEDVGPPPDRKDPAPWPSPDEVQALRDTIAVTAPQGAEFGRTEVIYLSVEGPTRQRAIALAKAVCDQLEAGLKQTRDRKAQSVIDELTETLALARTDLDAATGRLEAMESEVGTDLGELRILNQSGSGESNLRNRLNDIESDLRGAKAQADATEKQKSLLEAALRDPSELAAMPNRLLESQPGLRRLKDGLVDAQLRTSEILGKMSPDHPLARAAMAAEEEIRQQLQDELQVAVRGLEADLQVSQSQVESLRQQSRAVQDRLHRLAELRARYGSLVAEVENRTAIVETARKSLADAQARRSAAQSASLITRMDEPQTGNYPVGPGRTKIVLFGLAAGLLTGLGLVTLAAPLDTALRGRRWTDHYPLGRRATDAPRPGRRATDAVPAQPPSAATPPDDDRRTGTDRRSGDRRSAS